MRFLIVVLMMIVIVSADLFLPIDLPMKNEIAAGVSVSVQKEMSCSLYGPRNKTCTAVFYIGGSNPASTTISVDDFRSKAARTRQQLYKAIDFWNETEEVFTCTVIENVTEEGNIDSCKEFRTDKIIRQYARFAPVKNIKIEKGWYAGEVQYSDMNVKDQVNFSKTSLDPDVSACPVDIRLPGTYTITGTLNSSRTCITVNAPNVTISGNWNLIHYGWAQSGNWLQAVNRSAGAPGNYLSISHLYILQTNFTGTGTQTNIQNQYNVTIDGLSNYPGFTNATVASFQPCIDTANVTNEILMNITVSTAGGVTNPIRISGPATNLTIINSILNSTGTSGQAYPIQLSTVKNAFLENLTLGTSTTGSNCIYMSGSGQNITMNNIFCNNSNGANTNNVIHVGDTSSALNINLTNFIAISGVTGIAATGQNLRIENGTVLIYNGSRGGNGIGISIGTSSNKVNIHNVNISATQSGIAGLSVTAANVTDVLINIENVSSNVNYTRVLHYGISLAGTANEMTRINVSSNVNNTRCTGGSSVNISYVTANCSGNTSVGMYDSGNVYIYNSSFATNDSFSPIIISIGPLYMFNSTLRYVGSNYSMNLTSAAGTRNFTFETCDIDFSEGTNYLLTRSDISRYLNVYFLNVTNATPYKFLFEDPIGPNTPSGLTFVALQEYVRGNVTDAQNVSIENASFIATPIINGVQCVPTEAVWTVENFTAIDTMNCSSAVYDPDEGDYLHFRQGYVKFNLTKTNNHTISSAAMWVYITDETPSWFIDLPYQSYDVRGAIGEWSSETAIAPDCNTSYYNDVLVTTNVYGYNLISGSVNGFKRLIGANPAIHDNKTFIYAWNPYASYGCVDGWEMEECDPGFNYGINYYLYPDHILFFETHTDTHPPKMQINYTSVEGVTCPNSTNMSYTGADGLTNWSILTSKIFFDTNTTNVYTWNFTANFTNATISAQNSSNALNITKEQTVWVMLNIKTEKEKKRYGTCAVCVIYLLLLAIFICHMFFRDSKRVLEFPQSNRNFSDVNRKA